MTAYLLLAMLKIAIMAVLVASLGMEIPLALFCVFVLTKSLAVLVFLIFRRVVTKISKVKAFFMKGLSILLPILSTVYAVVRVWFLKKTRATVRLPFLSTIYAVIRGWFLKETRATNLQRERKIDVMNRHLKLQEELLQYGSTPLQGLANRLKLKRKTQKTLDLFLANVVQDSKKRQPHFYLSYGERKLKALKRERSIGLTHGYYKHLEEMYGKWTLQKAASHQKHKGAIRETLSKFLERADDGRPHGLKEVASKKIQNAFRNHVQAKKAAKEMETKMLELMHKMQALKL